VLLDRIGLLGLHRAAVAPVITEVKDILEGLAGLELLGHLQSGLIQPFVGVFGVEDADTAPVGKLEAVQMGQIPARKAGVDGLGEVTEGVPWADNEDAAWRGLAVNPAAAKEINPDPQPGSRHWRGSLWVLRQLLKRERRELGSLALFVDLDEPERGTSLQDVRRRQHVVAEIGRGLDESLANTAWLHGWRVQTLFKAVVVELGGARLIKEEDEGECYSEEATVKLPDYRLVLEDGEMILVEVKNVAPRCA
jgi:hypothetical protein